MQIPRLSSFPLFLIFMAGALGACGETNLVKDVAQGVGIGGEPRPAPDFVARTRAPKYEYLPGGESAPQRSAKAKDGAGAPQAEAEREATRARNEASGAAARQAASSAVPAEPVRAPAR